MVVARRREERREGIEDVTNRVGRVDDEEGDDGAETDENIMPWQMWFDRWLRSRVCGERDVKRLRVAHIPSIYRCGGSNDVARE